MLCQLPLNLIPNLVEWNKLYAHTFINDNSDVIVVRIIIVDGNNCDGEMNIVDGINCDGGVLNLLFPKPRMTTTLEHSMNGWVIE